MQQGRVRTVSFFFFKGLPKKKKKGLPEKPVRAQGNQDRKRDETSLSVILRKSWGGKMNPVPTGNSGT